MNISRKTKNSGQVMLLTVLLLGGIMLGASTIAGLLVLYQIKESGDISNSTKAIYAADTGIEWELYAHFKPDSARSHPWSRQSPEFPATLTNGAVFATISSSTSIRSIGSSVNSSRAFEVTFPN